MTKNAIFGHNCVVLGQTILISTGESKSFGTHITEKTPRYLVCIVFWSGMGRDGPKDANIWPFLGQGSLSFGGSKSFGTNVREKPLMHLLRIVFWSAMGPNGQKRPIFGLKSQFWAKFGRSWAKNPNFHGSN